MTSTSVADLLNRQQRFTELEKEVLEYFWNDSEETEDEETVSEAGNSEWPDDGISETDNYEGEDELDLNSAGLLTEDEGEDEVEGLDTASGVDGLEPDLDDDFEAQRVEVSNFKICCNQKCFEKFTVDEVLELRESFRNFTPTERDIFLMGILFATKINQGETTCGTKRTNEGKRKNTRISHFVLLGREIVCRTMFLHALGTSTNSLTNAKKHLMEHGISIPERKRGGRKANTAALSGADLIRGADFLKGFAEDHAVSLPGRMASFRQSDIVVLPSEFTKKSVYEKYCEALEGTDHRKMSLTSFTRLWKRYLPFIVVCRPMTDLCWTCQLNHTLILKSANMQEDQKEALLLNQQQHLQAVHEERQEYRAMAAKAKDTVERLNIPGLQEHYSPTEDFRMHYSFDFAQQIHYPSNPLQPGPIYFLVPRKCGLFGICCEGLQQQVNYLIDEGMCTDKGSKSVISYLHHFLETRGRGETEIDLHCDNCSGQNKNRYMLAYLCWRVMVGKHKEVTLNFMIAGHTKFSPDRCFGLLKRRFRRMAVNCLEDMCEVVRSSSTCNLNIPQLVGTEEGEVHVPVLDWHAFLKDFSALPGIKSMQHFRFSKSSPGTVFYRCSLRDEEKSFKLFRGSSIPQEECLKKIPPPGIPQERKRYLADNIRDFVLASDVVKDRVCPL